VNKSLIKSLRIGLASPETILGWSSGEVKKPETYNYRTYKPEKDGLFCERIFGPVKDYECACGKLKKIRFKDTVCDRCGVKVTSSKVRRERLGHIRLACPVAHIWFTKSIPNRFSAILGINGKEIEKIIYYVSHVVTRLDEEWLSQQMNAIEAAVRERVNTLKGEKRELRNLKEMSIFDLIKGSDGFDKGFLGEINQLSRQFIRPGGDIAQDERFSGTIDKIKNIIHERDLLKDYALAENVVDPTTKEVVGLARETLSYSVVFKLVDAGYFTFVAEDIAARHENQRRIEEIQFQIDSMERAVSRLKNLTYMDRITDQEFEDFNALKYFLQREDVVDLEGHVEISMGAKAVQDLLKEVDLERLAGDLEKELKTATVQKKLKLVKRLKVARAFIRSKNRPEWMILNVLPVLPPELRPMVELEGGRFASSDLNDLYRRVINRNNRLKKLIDIRAPESILRNEKRMLQEAVDSLVDNGRKGKAAVNTNNRALKSLSDLLKGKQGRFRQNLLGKRVDYSGRSVIVVGPKLKMHQCGLPKYMALELFKPFVLNKLINPDDPNQNISAARRMLDKAENPVVWDKLEEVIKEHPVLLNRAPTLHRLSIQAFQPVLIEGKAIQIHPLVCAAYNADFDGDQMAVHVPLSTAAQAEARLLMLASNNILLPANGKPVISPTQDVVLGLYYLTQVPRGGDPKSPDIKAYVSDNEAIMAYDNGYLSLQSYVKVPAPWPVLQSPEEGEVPVKIKGLLSTTVGRLILNKRIGSIADEMGVPAESRLPFYNFPIDKGFLSNIVSEAHQKVGSDFTTVLADALKNLGFEIATVGGITTAISDICVPPDKNEVLEKAEVEAGKIWSKLNKKLITAGEKDDEISKIWDQATKTLTKSMKENFNPLNPVFMMEESGARGKIDQVRQLAAMRGLIVGPSGRVLDFPIKSNFREGLSVHEYFISTHGGRKGLVDTALKTADSGYLTRRLVDVALDVSIREVDCRTTEGIDINISEEAIGSVKRAKKMLVGRVLAESVKDSGTGEVMYFQNEAITPETAERLYNMKIGSVKVRSVLTCETVGGVCAHCYGWDLATGRLAEVGDPVGVVAAQSIGEPGTQLTMRTFHTGGIKGRDITQGLPYVETLLEVRSVKAPEPLCEIDGKVAAIKKIVYQRATIRSTDGLQEKSYEVVVDTSDNKLVAKRGTQVKKGDEIDEKGTVKAEFGGVVVQVVEDDKKTFYRICVTGDDGTLKVYDTPREERTLLVKVGDQVKRAQRLCEGDFDVRRYHELEGDLAAQRYLVDTIQDIYESQNVDTNSKHIEIIAKQMIRYVRVESVGDYGHLLSEGDLYDKAMFTRIVKEAEEQGKQPPKGKAILQGISKASLSAESWLAAASFQETTRVLTEASIEGKVDKLRGLKENVIIGGLIPVGTGRSREDLLVEANRPIAL
jgi:DNA-directed RNA polymerase subunit beta'